MKKIYSLLAGLILTVSVCAQAPQKMSYQAVIRNSSNALVSNTQIGMEINIRQGSPTGAIVYTQTLTPTTNANGLVSIEIGGAGFDAINWGSNTYYIETKTAVAAPLTTYTIIGVSPFLSVPYALNAKTSDNGITTVQADAIVANTAKVGITTEQTNKLSGIAEGAEVNVQADWNQTNNTTDDFIKNKPTIPTAADGSETKVTAGTNMTVTGIGTITSPYIVNSTVEINDFYLGQDTLGGIVYYIYLDQNGEQHGLIVSKTETTAQYQSIQSLTNAVSSWNGVYNMNLMTNSPAKSWITTNFSTDWYLPSIDELSILWHNRFHVNKSLNNIGATLLSNSAFYWSSTENEELGAYFFQFVNGNSSHFDKLDIHNVRAIRAF